MFTNWRCCRTIQPKQEFLPLHLHMSIAGSVWKHNHRFHSLTLSTFQPPPLCFIYLAHMQPACWQLCPSKDTCSWWLFAHLSPSRTLQPSISTGFCFIVVLFLSATIMKRLPAEQAACANISWAPPPPACSSSERLAGFQHFITLKRVSLWKILSSRASWFCAIVHACERVRDVRVCECV